MRSTVGAVGADVRNQSSNSSRRAGEQGHFMYLLVIRYSGPPTCTFMGN